jgi:hypothetical protein
MAEGGPPAFYLPMTDDYNTPRGMLKKAAGLTHPTPSRQDAPFRGQGRREFGDRGVFFFHPPTPSCRDSSITGGTLQGDERLRTTLGEKRVSARRGRAGEKRDFFSIPLGFFLPEEERSI